MSQMRIHSAGRCEAERANWALRDSVLRLEEELTFTKSQLSKVTNEFDTLVLLVKRAWSGDSMASIQVAKLIGVASPEYQIQSSSGQMIVKVKPKSRSLNNWLKLTIGVLSNVSKSEKAEHSESQSLYLSQRQTYLAEEQMATDQIAKRPAFLRSRSSSVSDLSGQARSTKLQSMTGKTEKSFTRRPSCDHLYRPTSHKPNQKEDDQIYSELSSLNGAGLFELTDLLAAADPRQRPPSGFRQRGVGSFQDKPRSAVYARGERPLKYETTRPVSTHRVKDKPRAQSAKVSRVKLRELLRHTVFDDDVGADGLEGTAEKKRNISPISAGSNEEEGTLTKTENPEMAKIRSRIEKLDSVIELDKELNNMARMEDDFRRKAVELQKRLGIDISGMVL